MNLTSSIAYQWRAPELGPEHEIQLPQGRLRYYECGRIDAPVILFIHGWLTNANLWRKVAAYLAEDYRCIMPDLPFGSHLQTLNDDADLTPNGCGQLILDFIQAMNLSHITLVGNDSGGAYSQIATAANSRQISRLVLTPCETPYDSFPPPAFAGLVEAAKSEHALRGLLEALRDPSLRTSPAAYGLLAKHPIPPMVSDSFALPILMDPSILRDARKAFVSASEQYVQQAGDTLINHFEAPVLFLCAAEDNFFALHNAQRYAAALRNAKIEIVSDSYSLMPEDQPASLADHLRSFVALL